jgi:hypothetical protein
MIYRVPVWIEFNVFSRDRIKPINALEYFIEVRIEKRYLAQVV